MDTLINLLAITDTNDPQILANTDEMAQMRATIFEEFANGGLALLKHKLKGEVNYTTPLLLLMKGTKPDYEDIESLVGVF